MQSIVYCEEIWRDFSQRLPWRTVLHVSHLRRHWETCFPLAVVAREGLEETLSALHAQGIRLGIVTNGEVQKPDPRIFAHALAEIGCRAAETWFVGDDPVTDMLGAAAVGLRAIWLTGVRPWPTDRPESQWQIAALREMVALVHSEQKRYGPET
jgi:putative hydrolase of the HAD superfamily